MDPWGIPVLISKRVESKLSYLVHWYISYNFWSIIVEPHNIVVDATQYQRVWKALDKSKNTVTGVIYILYYVIY